MRHRDNGPAIIHRVCGEFWYFYGNLVQRPNHGCYPLNLPLGVKYYNNNNNNNSQEECPICYETINDQSLIWDCTTFTNNEVVSVHPYHFHVQCISQCINSMCPFCNKHMKKPRKFIYLFPNITNNKVSAVFMKTREI